jgi:hypothetical protein
MKILKLTLKKKWFDLIKSGAKLEEYREIKAHWLSRFIDKKQYPAESEDDYKNIVENILYDYRMGFDLTNVINEYYCQFRQFTHIQFTNGYSKNSPTFTIELLGISVGRGNPDWGAPTDKYVFILKLGKIINNETDNK